MKSNWYFMMISLLFSVNIWASSSSTSEFCGDNTLALQILGSGGPIMKRSLKNINNARSFTHQY